MKKILSILLAVVLAGLCVGIIALLASAVAHM